MSETSLRGGGGKEAHGTMRVVSRTASVFRALEGAPNGLSLAQISERSGLPRSTVHRLVTAMQGEGLLVAAAANGRTRIAPGFVRLAMSSRRDPAEDLRPCMERLRSRIGETVDLSILDGTDVVFIDRVVSDHPLRVVIGIGERLPTHCVPNGRAILAALPGPERERHIPAELTPVTVHTVTDRTALMALIGQAEVDGYAIAREEATVGVCGAAIAVTDAYGITAAISVPVPTTRFDGRQQDIVDALLVTKAEANEAIAANATG